MRRRDFITLVGGAALAAPSGGQAQQRTAPVVGFLSAASQEGSGDILAALRAGLGDMGFIEDRTIKTEYRWAAGYGRLPALATELVRHPVVLLIAAGDSAALAAKAATTTIPIVFSGGNDPVKLGLVASLNRPGGNLTGAVNLNIELAPKRLEVVHELLPKAKRVAFLLNPAGANAAAALQSTQAAARKIGIQLDVLQAGTDSELDAAFSLLAETKPDALLIGADIFYNSRSMKLAALAVRHTIPTVFQTRDFATAGGLMSYGSSRTETYHKVGLYAARILKGEKPGDLPIQQATKIDMIVNLKAAKALGVHVPESVLARADEVIE
jgi:putative ABC transport system substrate-binding protein